ncbi:MAG: DUF58 domain-containing protein [Oscillochloridaceae bacterium umkhey_bin13]
MWFKTIFRPKTPVAPRPAPRRTPKPAEAPLFDEAFLRRMARMSLQAQRTLRGNPASGEHPSRHKMPATVFSDHRPYTSGDDLRYVDWNAYARQDHVLVKLGEAEQDVNVHLLIDASRSMTFGGPPRLRLAQQLAGALGYLALSHSDRLHVVPLASPTRPFGPAQGKAQVPALLRYLSQISPGGEAQLASLVSQHTRRNPQGGIMVICSDFLTNDQLDAVLAPLAPPRWQTLVLHLLDRADLDPSTQGPIELEDSENGQRLALTLDEATLTAYRSAVADWRERLRASCARRGATYAPLMSHWPLEQQVVPYLRARRLLT